MIKRSLLQTETFIPVTPVFTLGLPVIAGWETPVPIPNTEVKPSCVRVLVQSESLREAQMLASHFNPPLSF